MPFTDQLNIVFPMRDLTAQAKLNAGPVAGPESYTVGGETIALADIGLSEVWWAVPGLATNGTVVLHVLYVLDGETSKLKWFDADGTEVADATDLSDYTFTFVAAGK